jgi:ferric-dicitrate binding protein FerR (iron transport regulator)
MFPKSRRIRAAARRWSLRLAEGDLRQPPDPKVWQDFESWLAEDSRHGPEFERAIVDWGRTPEAEEIVKHRRRFLGAVLSGAMLGAFLAPPAASMSLEQSKHEAESDPSIGVL